MAEGHPNPKKSKLSLSSYEWFLPEAEEALTKCLENATVFSVMNIPAKGTPASELTASKEKNATDHFIEEEIDEATKENVRSRYVAPLFEEAAKSLGLKVKRLPSLIGAFELEVIKSYTALGFKVDNESEVRFSIGDPLVKLLTDFNPQYKVCTSVQSFFLLTNVSFPFLFVSMKEVLGVGIHIHS